MLDDDDGDASAAAAFQQLMRLSRSQRPRPENAELALTDQAKALKGGIVRICREDVADLIALAYNHPSCGKATLECKWAEAGPST